MRGNVGYRQVLHAASHAKTPLDELSQTLSTDVLRSRPEDAHLVGFTRKTSVMQYIKATMSGR
jgi:hypothetical protein